MDERRGGIGNLPFLFRLCYDAYIKYKKGGNIDEWSK